MVLNPFKSIFSMANESQEQNQTAPIENQKKLKFNDSEYLVDSLPDTAKKLITGLRTADTQTRMYEDTLKLISISKRKMAEELQKALEGIEPIKNG